MSGIRTFDDFGNKLILILLNPDMPGLFIQCRSRSVGFFKMMSWLLLALHCLPFNIWIQMYVSTTWIKNWPNFPICNPKSDLHNNNTQTKFGKSTDIYSSYCLQNKNMDMWLAGNSVKNWPNLPISSPKPDLHNINAHTKFGQNSYMFT